MYKLHQNPWIGHCLAIIAGLLLPLSLAPFHQPLLAYLCASFLLISWSECSPKIGAFRGFLFGMAAFLAGVHWVFIAIHRYGHAPILIAGYFTLMFVGVLSLYPMLQGYTLNRFFPKASMWKFFLAFPVSWVLFDLLRGWLFSGFPWLLIGYSQIDTLLKYFAPFGTVHLLTFFTAFIGATIISPLFLKRWQWIFSVLILCVLFGSGYKLSQKPEDIGEKIPLKISAIQGNVAQEDKWDPELIIRTTQQYRQLTETVWDADLIIWPEAAVPVFQTNAIAYIEELDNIAQEKKSNLIFGIPISDHGTFFNGLMMVGESHGTYKKRHLVPFGEYTPFEPLSSWIMNQLNIPMSNFKPGPKNQPLLHVDGINIAAFICYEIIYPFLVRKSLPEANLLLVLSDDSWFGDSIAKYQHLQMAQMRAIENNRYVIFSTNTGITAIIKPNGDVQEKLPEDTQAILTGTVYGVLQ